MLVISCGIFECVVIVIVGIIGLSVSGSCASRLPRWEGAPVVGAIWKRRGGVEEALDQLAPVFLVRGFVNPISQGAKSVNLDCGYILEKKTKVLDHEVFPRHLWTPHSAFMITPCSDHVAGGAVGWSVYHFSEKVHLSRGDHVADTGDGVEFSSHFIVVEPLFADCGH